MARPSDELLLAWHHLSDPDGTAGWRTIAINPGRRCALAAGRRFPGNEEAILAGFAGVTLSASEKLPEGSGFSIERVDPYRDGRLWLALSRKTGGSADLFQTMACDLAGALDDDPSATTQQTLRLFLGRVRAWQEFMRKGSSALSVEEEIGLIGELLVLGELVDCGVPFNLAVESWDGPLNGIQDFLIGTGAIEVKSTLSSIGFPAKIGSLDQLDDNTRRPLFVAGVRLRPSAEGRTLPDLVEKMRGTAEGDAEARRLLSERLIAAGFFDAHTDRYIVKILVVEIRAVEVDEEFPRLIRGNTPAGIQRVTYEIDLDQIAGPRLGLDQSLAMLGAM